LPRFVKQESMPLVLETINRIPYETVIISTFPYKIKTDLFAYFPYNITFSLVT
jgi:hypothetical protein